MDRELGDVVIPSELRVNEIRKIFDGTELFVHGYYDHHKL